MINITKSYLKIWKVEDKGKSVTATTTSSKKDKITNAWVNSNWNVRFVGKCLEDAKRLAEGDKIVINNGVVENVWDKEKNRAWLNVLVFEFNWQEQNNNMPSVADVEADSQDDLPF